MSHVTAVALVTSRTSVVTQSVLQDVKDQGKLSALYVNLIMLIICLGFPTMFVTNLADY